MAYVTCSKCGLNAFTVAYWSSVDHCGRCGAELPHPRRSVEVRRSPEARAKAAAAVARANLGAVPRMRAGLS